MHKDGLFIDWHLLDGCNHDCEYNHEPDNIMSERFLREELLLAAYRLFSLNRPEYIVHLYGGEPSIHPHFPELFKYLVTAGRNTYIVLDTNGLRSLDYYASILKYIPRNRICVNIDVHLKYMDLKQLLLLIGHVVEKGSYCRIIINHVADQADKAQLFCEKLIKFRQQLPFIVEIRFPLGGTAPWLPELGKIFANISQPQLQMPGWAVTARIPSSSPKPVLSDKPYVCLGINSVHVSWDGTCTQGLFTDDQPFVSQISENVSIRQGMPLPPSFTERSVAASYLSAFECRAAEYEINGGPVRHPFNMDLDDTQKLRMHLKRLTAESVNGTISEPYPTIWTGHRENIEKIHAFLADEDSRIIFLRWLKARVSGNSGYLVDSEYKIFAHPAIHTGEVPLEPNDSSNRLLRLSEGVTPESINRLLPKVQWYCSSLEIALSTDISALSVLLEVQKFLSNYMLYLGQHGERTILYALPKEPRKHRHPVPPRPIDGIPLVSLILASNGDADALNRTLESVLACGMPRYEVIVVHDADDSQITAVADAFVQRAPWRIRLFRMQSWNGLTAAWDAGLDMAQGEYVSFLRTGDVLIRESLASAVEALDADGADLALLSATASRKYFIDGSTGLMRYLTDGVGTSGTRNKVYRASLLRDYGVSFADLPADMEDQCFDLPVLAFARNLAFLPGVLVRGEEESKTRPENIWQVFLTNLDTFYRFCAAHDIALDRSEVRAWILRRFVQAKPAMIEVLGDLTLDNIFNDRLDEETIDILTRTPYIVQSICDELAQGWWESKGIKVTQLPSPRAIRCVPYEGAATDFDYTYPISIIVTVEDGASLVCLECLAEEDSSLLECVIIDNACNMEIVDTLTTYADLYPNFRLIRMEEKALLTQCRNTGLSEVKGEGIVFMSSDFVPSPGFINNAAKAVIEKIGDIIVYSEESKMSTEDRYNDKKSFDKNLSIFFENRKSFDIDGIIFMSKYIKNESLLFKVIDVDYNARFILQSLCNCKIAIKYKKFRSIKQKDFFEEIYSYTDSIYYINKIYEMLPSYSDILLWSKSSKKNLLNALNISYKKYWLPIYSQCNYDKSLPQESVESYKGVNKIFSLITLTRHIYSNNNHIK